MIHKPTEHDHNNGPVDCESGF